MLPILVGLAAWEAIWWADRVQNRQSLYDRAKAHARALRMPLVVLGAPDRGATRGPGCGDLTLDLGPTQCPCSMQIDVSKQIPLPTNSAIIFVSCVLEYVNDLPSAWHELQRVAPGRVYVSRVQPWTLTAYLYPNARRTIPYAMCEPR